MVLSILKNGLVIQQVKWLHMKDLICLCSNCARLKLEILYNLRNLERVCRHTFARLWAISRSDSPNSFMSSDLQNIMTSEHARMMHFRYMRTNYMAQHHEFEYSIVKNVKEWYIQQTSATKITLKMSIKKIVCF